MSKMSKYMLNRDPEKTKDMLTVGELKAILQNWSDDSPVTVSVDNKSAPRDIKRTGTLITKRHKTQILLLVVLVCFCGEMKIINKNNYFFENKILDFN